MADVTIATWNLHQAVDRRASNVEATWRYLADEVRPTVALLQEALVTGGEFSSRAGDLPYETSVVAFEGQLESLPEVTTRYSSKTSFAIHPTVPGTFAVAKLVGLGEVEPLTVASLYGRMAPLYAQTSILRVIADLIPLFDSSHLNGRIVIGGDLNVYDQTTDRVMRDRWLAILATIESLGLVNLLKQTQPVRGPLKGCPCKAPGCWHVETFRHRNRPKGRPGYFTTDYLFATRELADRLVALELPGHEDQIWNLSDHRPLVARFDL